MTWVFNKLQCKFDVLVFDYVRRFGLICGASSTFNTYLITASGGEKDDRRLRLLKAILRGDLNAAELVLRSDKSAARLSINKRGDTPLHIAALAKQTAIAHMLVKYLEERDLVFKNGSGRTAFFFAALSGDVEIAKVMYDKNKTLPTIRSDSGMSPIAKAAKMGNKKMVEYLHKITPLQDFTAEEFRHILVGTIHTEMYDITLDILKADHRSIVTSPNVMGGPNDMRRIALQRFQKDIWFNSKAETSRSVGKGALRTDSDFRVRGNF